MPIRPTFGAMYEQSVRTVAIPGQWQSSRTQQVRAVLSLAPRSADHHWAGEELRDWVDLTGQVTVGEIDSALALAAAWGAQPQELVGTAAHIVLVRIAPTSLDRHSARLRANVESVCRHLRAHLTPVVADRLPRVTTAAAQVAHEVAQPANGTADNAALWAYFFGCLALLLLAVIVTR
jgi:hypothetical protein